MWIVKADTIAANSLNAQKFIESLGNLWEEKTIQIHKSSGGDQLIHSPCAAIFSGF